MTRWPRNILAVGALSIAFSGCSEGSRINPGSPAPPDNPAPPAPSIPRNVVHEGVIRKFMPTGDPQPVPNLTLMAWDPVVLYARVGATRLPDTATDQSGRFRIEASQNVLFLETAPGSPFKFICPSYPHHGVSDVYVLDASWSGEPWLPGLSLLGIYGKVTERVGGVVQPVAGATVTLDDGSLDPPTITSANGFYSICSVTGADFSRVVTARKTGYRMATVGITWGWDYDVNFTLVRN